MSSNTVKFFTGILYFSLECNFHLFPCWSSSDILLSSDWILGLALSYAVCTYETRYWAWPPQYIYICIYIYIYIYIKLNVMRWVSKVSARIGWEKNPPQSKSRAGVGVGSGEWKTHLIPILLPFLFSCLVN